MPRPPGRTTDDEVMAGLARILSGSGIVTYDSKDDAGFLFVGGCGPASGSIMAETMNALASAGVFSADSHRLVQVGEAAVSWDRNGGLAIRSSFLVAHADDPPLGSVPLYGVTVHGWAQPESEGPGGSQSPVFMLRCIEAAPDEPVGVECTPSPPAYVLGEFVPDRRDARFIA